MHHIGSHHLLHRQFVGRHRSGGLLLAGVLRVMGQSMLLIFLLIYLFGLGFSPLAIIAYGLVFSLASLALNYWAIGWLISTWGPRKTIALSNASLILLALGLSGLSASLVEVYLLAVLHALAIESYLLSQHVYLAATTTKGQGGGRQVSRQFSAEPIGGLLGSLLAGLTAWIWSPAVTSLLAGLILVVGGVLAFVHHDESGQAHHHYDRRKIWSIYRQLSRDWRDPVLAAGVVGFNFVYQIWALYLGVFFLAAASDSSGYFILGATSFGGALVGLWATSSVGRRLERGQSAGLIRSATIGEALLGVGRLSLAVISQAAGMFVYGAVALAEWWTFEARNIAVYRRSYQLSSRFAKHKVEYSIGIENLGLFFQALLFGLACLISLALSFEATLLVSMAGGIALVSLLFLLLAPKQLSARPASD